ncbi:hypothetical protein [Pseudorhodoplanes sinuspersici]|nr:hypothetical protein [Pseudorhodoplanes sinuspersici]
MPLGGDPGEDLVIIFRRHLTGTGAPTLVLLLNLLSEISIAW